MRTQRYTSVLWSFVCLLVIFTFLPIVAFNPESQLDYRDSAFVVLVKDWEIAYDIQLSEDTEWLPFDSEARAALDDYKGPIWLKRDMPDLEWKNPYMFFSLMRQFEAFLDGELIYSFNMDGQYSRLNPFRTLHTVELESGSSGKPLLLHALWQKDEMAGSDLVLVGESGKFLYASIISEISFLLVGFIGLLTGFIALVLFIARREKLYGWFALFCLAMGAGLLLSCRSMQWFANMTEIYYWEQLLTPLAIWGCAGFYGNAMNMHRSRLIRLVHGAFGLFMLAYIVTAAAAPLYFSQSAALLDAILAIAFFIVITSIMVIRSKQLSPDGGVSGSEPFAEGAEKQWLLRGYVTFAIGGIAVMIAYMFPNLLMRLHNTIPYLYRVIEGLIPNILLLFMIAMTMVMVGRVRRVYLESERNAVGLREKNRELEQFHRNLEHLVETRTAELERANRTLAVTLREKAETLSEMSVLEERNRIAHEMHDVVGHTLTAAIVQLEATKQIATRESAMPMDKLELLSGLVRKGLDDIRKAVRLMTSEDENPLPLDAALRELIQYTEDTMDVIVEYEISLPHDLSLGRMTEGVLYHALQEGLTNGIRHGKGKRFHFTIGCRDRELRFLLVNDGEPLGAALPGFGLASMTERIELLGGEVSLHSSTAEDGSPQGCELSIRLPLSVD